MQLNKYMTLLHVKCCQLNGDALELSTGIFTSSDDVVQSATFDTAL